MSKDDKKAIGFTILGAGLSVILRPVLGGIAVLVGVVIILSAHVSQPNSPALNRGLVDSSGQPITLITTSKPWMLPAILIAMALIVVTGMVWELGRTYYPNLSITLVIPRPPDPPDFVWTQGGHHQNPMASYLPPIEVSFNCYFDPDVLPIKVPAGRVAYVFLLHKEVNASRHQVQFYEIPNFNGDVAKMWPDPHLVQEERQRSDQGVSALRCDVKNHGQQDILELTIPIDTLYDLDHNSGTWRTRLQNTIVINPLDRGDTFTFYVVNECPVETQTLIPHYAAANLVGERTQRRFQIELENPYAPSQGFGIGQSKVYWAGMSCP